MVRRKSKRGLEVRGVMPRPRPLKPIGERAEFEAKVFKSGHALAVIVPAYVRHAVGIEAGDRVKVTVERETRKK